MRGINSECVDLIYLDPPFQRNPESVSPLKLHPKIAEELKITEEESHFKDMFGEVDLKREWAETIEQDHYELHTILDAIRKTGRGMSMRTLKDKKGDKSRVQISDFGYLAYMAIRLIECHRVLKKTGSIYLHCDPTMSHSLKLVMDCIFGESNFRNEIVWCYKGDTNAKKEFPKKTDLILFYSKTDANVFNLDDVRVPYESGRKERKGRYGAYTVNPKGKKCLNWWADIPSFSTATQSNERTGYSTQKPRALLERIIKASSNVGDTVLDPFCGCATACVSAEKLNRRWIGIDIKGLAYKMVQYRLVNEGVQPNLDDGMDYEGRDNKVKKRTTTKPRTDGGPAPDAPIAKFVYVISDPNEPGTFKVGVSNNPEKRVNSMQTGRAKRDLKLEHKRLTFKYKELERYIHKKFDRRHEWVSGKLQDIISAIENYKTA